MNPTDFALACVVGAIILLSLFCTIIDIIKR